MKTSGWVFLTAAAVVLVACAGTSGAPQSAASCPPPVPGPRPILDLSYPVPGAAAVPTTLGEVILVGFYQGVTGNATVTMTTSSNASVPVGAFTAPPSPMPTPYAVPTGWGGNIPFVAVPVPTLSPSTTYTLSYSFADDGGPPPSCKSIFSATSGSFTTR